MMLRDLYRHQEVEGEVDADFVANAIGSGHYWALDWKYDGLFEDNMKDPQVVSEVANLLTMWSTLENSYANLSQADKNRVMTETNRSGKELTFPGFDGNEEPDHFFIARFMINDLKRFGWFQGRDLNSHWPRLASYRRMLSAFQSMQEHLVGRTLTASEIIHLLNAPKSK